jgi:hypothetical protein
MANVPGKSELLASLKAKAAAMGLRLLDENADGFRAEQENILVKWFLGQRKVLYRMAVRLSEGDRVANFREAVTERSWGLLPPSITVEKSSLKGWERSGTHEERSAAGGGKVDFARVRETLKQAIAEAGWTFHLEGGRLP